MEQTELKERRYVGVRETLIYGVANGGQVIGYNLVRMQLTFFLVTVFGIPGQAVSLMIFGGGSIFDFALAIFVGVVAGT